MTTETVPMRRGSIGRFSMDLPMTQRPVRCTIMLASGDQCSRTATRRCYLIGHVHVADTCTQHEVKFLDGDDMDRLIPSR